MTYDQSIQTLQSLAIKKGINYSLKKLTPCLNELGNPHISLPKTIHIAGTNGKGSTLKFIQSILMQAGHSVVSFTSPHLDSYTERIQFNNTPISKRTFCKLFKQCLPVLGQGLTEFEVLTLMALCYIAEQKPDVCLFEVGLGGRLDATNIIKPDCCIITSIDYDHQDILGSTLDLIANEKAGIIKSKTPILTPSTQPSSVINVLHNTAIQNHAPFYIVPPLPETTKLGLKGNHQYINASLATHCISLIFPSISNSIIQKGLESTTHWGRFTVIESPEQTIIIDAAHNIASLETLKTTLSSLFPKISPTIIFGLHKSKPILTLLPLIESLSMSTYYCCFSSTHSHSFEDITSKATQPIRSFKISDPLPSSPLIVITGSIYFIGQFYKTVKLQA